MTLRRLRLRSHSRRPEVTFTADTLNFSAAFIQQYGLADKTHAAFFADETEPLRVYFRFLDGAEDDALKVRPASQSKPSLGRVVAARQLAQHFPALASAAPRTRARVSRCMSSMAFYADLVPGFGCLSGRRDAISNMPRHATGIYRYTDQGEAVYIGRGKIAARLKAPERGDWSFDCVEWTAIGCERSEIAAEAHHLAEFTNQFGRLPRYNRVAGFAPAAMEAVA